MGTAEIYQEDCFETFKRLEDNSIDLVLCDPPYGTTDCRWDSIIPLEPMWVELRRITKPEAAIVFTSAQPFTTKLISSNFDEFKYCWVWLKNRATDFVNAKNKPMRSHEDVVVFSRGKTANGSKNRMNYFPQGLTYVGKMSKKTKNQFGKTIRDGVWHKDEFFTSHTGYPKSVLKFDCEMRTVHPTQKPVALMEYLIQTYSKDGDRVLDFAMGSGTTGVAAINTGRKFVGCDFDPEHFETAKERIEGVN